MRKPCFLYFHTSYYLPPIFTLYSSLEMRAKSLFLGISKLLHTPLLCNVKSTKSIKQ
jgi:hypothetical protein